MVKEAKLEIFSLIKNKQKGLSLVELLFVIIIVAGVLVSLSKFKTPKKYSLPSVVEEINQILQKAYQNALINKSLYQVRFFFDEEHHIVQ
jgi:prepilin-type N-terminal cleavage/methylation domain-containing protein